MKAVENKDSAGEAVAFLSARVKEEARRSSIPLTDSEIKQLSFTEEAAADNEIAAAQDFEDVRDADAFEAKISRLLRKAFKDDVKHGLRSTWEKHLSVLRSQDAYILVMVDQARIPRPKSIARPLVSAIVSQTFKGRPSDIAAGLITILGVVYFLVLHMGWSRRGGPIFGDFAENLIPSEQIRGAFLLIWMGSMIWLLVRSRN